MEVTLKHIPFGPELHSGRAGPEPNFFIGYPPDRIFLSNRAAVLKGDIIVDVDTWIFPKAEFDKPELNQTDLC